MIISYSQILSFTGPAKGFKRAKQKVILFHVPAKDWI
jgi:hypothetical protein